MKIKNQSGVMLLEVLIGMLLFLIGIMGIIGLQAVSMKNTIDAKYRTEASYLANQLISRMWTDTSNLGSYELAAGSVCPSTPSTDLERWVCDVKNTLPNATGVNGPVVHIVGSKVTIQIHWKKDSNDPLHEHLVITDISAT